MAITRLDESAEYEAARHKREKRKENKSIAGSKRGSSGGGGGAAGLGGGVGGGLGGGGGASAIKEEGKDSEFSAIENLSGFELLSDREKVLCNSMNLSPTRYLTVKTIIIKDHLQKRQGIPSKSRLPSYLDKVLKKRILNSCRRAAGYPEKPPNYTDQRFGCKNNDCKYIFLLFYIASQKSL